MSSVRLAHLSDLHFSKISWGISQFFSKRWIGNFNFLLRRRKEFDYSLLEELLPLFLEEKVQKVLISGDVSCTSLEVEFIKASLFVETLKKEGIEVVILPGNHDHYTKRETKEKTFYKFFQKPGSSYSLEKDRLEVIPLNPFWSLIALDTTLATHLFSCKGEFSKELEDTLQKTLETIPRKTKIIIANHFPILLPKDESLQREAALLAILKKYSNIKLYLHGHTHKRRITDLSDKGLPVIIDSGSASHKFRGSFNLLDCEENSCLVRPYTWQKQAWTAEKPVSFTWRTL